MVLFLSSWLVSEKKNKQQSKPIDNPFVKDVEKIATSFSVTNFPESLDANSLWKEFHPFGRIVDAFIANKPLKLGKRFGFVRFMGVCNGEEFVKTLSNIWIGSYHVFVSIAKFQRQANTDSNPNKNGGPDPRPHVAPLRPNSSKNGPPLFPSTHSYASVANGEAVPKGFSNNGVLERNKSIQLIDQDLIKVEDTSTVLLVKVKVIDSISNLYVICRNEGFVDLKLHYIGGLWVWFQFENEKSEAFKSNDSLKSFWAAIKTVSPLFIVDERLIWIEITGLPLCAWGSNALKKVTSLFGKFKFFDTETEDAMSMGRVCIATKVPSRISETVSVIIHDKFGEQKSGNSNGEENSNEDIDDYIDQIVEENVKSNSIKNATQENKEEVCHEPDSTEVKESTKEDEVNADNSDNSIPPGFESLFRGGKDGPHSSSRSR
ncbi:RNA-directed DNA polymerase, eukaryota, reverse transcriptase zinc-binding domain protein, partial [Tanacetum coccineum]